MAPVCLAAVTRSPRLAMRFNSPHAHTARASEPGGGVSSRRSRPGPVAQRQSRRLLSGHMEVRLLSGPLASSTRSSMVEQVPLKHGDGGSSPPGSYSGLVARRSSRCLLSTHMGVRVPRVLQVFRDGPMAGQRPLKPSSAGSTPAPGAARRSLARVMARARRSSRARRRRCVLHPLSSAEEGWSRLPADPLFAPLRRSAGGSLARSFGITAL